ncbi:MAG: hypothetical protein P4L69_15915 [Desulfosporosinus sp.]|nr:hypothetical protein [Desulfosporosinus sp.]
MLERSGGIEIRHGNKVSGEVGPVAVRGAVKEQHQRVRERHEL